MAKSKWSSVTWQRAKPNSNGKRAIPGKSGSCASSIEGIGQEISNGKEGTPAACGPCWPCAWCWAGPKDAGMTWKFWNWSFLVLECLGESLDLLQYVSEFPGKKNMRHVKPLQAKCCNAMPHQDMAKGPKYISMIWSSKTLSILHLAMAGRKSSEIGAQRRLAVNIRIHIVHIMHVIQLKYIYDHLSNVCMIDMDISFWHVIMSRNSDCTSNQKTQTLLCCWRHGF